MIELARGAGATWRLVIARASPSPRPSPLGRGRNCSSAGLSQWFLKVRYCSQNDSLSPRVRVRVRGKVAQKRTRSLNPSSTWQEQNLEPALRGWFSFAHAEHFLSSFLCSSLRTVIREGLETIEALMA